MRRLPQLLIQPVDASKSAASSCDRLASVPRRNSLPSPETAVCDGRAVFASNHTIYFQLLTNYQEPGVMGKAPEWQPGVLAVQRWDGCVFIRLLFIYLSLQSNAYDCALIYRLKKRRHKRTGSKLGQLLFLHFVCRGPSCCRQKEEEEGKRLRRSRKMWRTCERNVEGRAQLFLALGNLGFCSQIYDDRFPNKSFKIRKSKGLKVVVS